ncbi:hypothetical protein HYN59_16675 [Flavobacterium album]|uniref:Uncharacterized protein n=1 Tax=Flavobacterium album TaxID=2175091 RepID=A0A2S1R1U8_9FLAO|nr:hypothetical protein [Flavobacterium album]AWH86640.1 hypothetical protein HYN59_16675 [Flavobacterium album]
MKTIKDFNTDGVLVIANTTKLKGTFPINGFNYDYPEGLSELIKNGTIHIITTDGDVKAISFVFDKEEVDTAKWKLNDSNNYLKVEEGDEVRLMAHGDFTRVCDWKGGDFGAYVDDSPFDTKRLLKSMPKIDIPTGYHKVNVYTKAKLRKYAFPEFIFVMEPASPADTNEITLEPLECYGG